MNFTLLAVVCLSDSSHDSGSKISGIISDAASTRTNVVKSFAKLQILVLSVSGVAETTGRMTEKLSPADTPQKYISSDVYFAEGKQAKAEEILQAAEMGDMDQPTSMPHSSLQKIISRLLSVFDIRGFISTVDFIVSRQ